MTSTGAFSRGQSERAWASLSRSSWQAKANAGELDWDHPEAFSLASLVGVGDGGLMRRLRPTAIVQPRSVAQGFADRLNTVLNRTVSDARLSLIARPGASTRFLIACVNARAAADRLPHSAAYTQADFNLRPQPALVRTASYLAKKRFRTFSPAADGPSMSCCGWPGR